MPANPKRKLFIVLLVSGLVVLVVGTAYFALFFKPRVIINVAPDSHQVAIDGNEFAGRQTRLTVGEHHISIKKTGFVPYESNINLRPFQKLVLEFALRPLPVSRRIIEQNITALAGEKSSGKLFYYDEAKNQLFWLEQSADSNGKQNFSVIPATPAGLPNWKKIIFSPDFQLAIVKLANGETGLYDFKRYDLVNQEYIPWGNTIGDVAWNPIGHPIDKNVRQLIYYYEGSDGEKSLIKTDSDRKTIERIFDLRGENLTNPEIDWSADGRNLLLTGKNNLYLYDIHSNTLTWAIKNSVLSAVFSPDNTHLLYTQNSQLNILEYQIINALSPGSKSNEAGRAIIKESKKLNLEVNAKKAVFLPGGKEFIVPTGLGLMEVNAATGDIKTLYHLDKNPIKAENFTVSIDGKTLYYLANGNVYSLTIDNGIY